MKTKSAKDKIESVMDNFISNLSLRDQVYVDIQSIVDDQVDDYIWDRLDFHYEVKNKVKWYGH